MKRSLMAVLLCLTALPLLAESHTITKIDFRSRIPANILRSQSALSENRDYTDDELELAVSRLRRLSFVYDARYHVDGSTLVIDVSDEHHFFYGVNLLGETQVHLHNSFLDTGIGGRFYVPSGGVAEGSIGNLAGRDENIGAANIQYTQYGIAGTRLFASASLSRSLGGVFGTTEVQPALTIGAPLSLTQTLTLVAYGQGYQHESHFALVPRPLRNEHRRRALELHWRYDTTNDPFFATRGRSLEIAPGYIHDNDLFEGFSTPPLRIFTEHVHDNQTVLNVAGENYWRVLNDRTMLIGGVTARLRRHDSTTDHADFITGSTFTFTEKQAGVSLRLAHNFFDRGEATDTRHRLELGFNYVFDRFAPNRDQRYLETQLAYAFRNRWGTVRLVLSRSTAGIFHP